MGPNVFIKPIEGDMTDCIRECFDKFGGVESICKGNIFIKINGTAPNTEIITNHEVVLSTIKVIKEVIKPENIYVMDNSAVTTFTRLVFDLENFSKRIEDLGAKPLYLDEQESINIDFKGKALDKPIPVPKILYKNLVENKGENIYLNIPKLKTHIQCGVTLCIKNQHGLLYDEEKIYNHHLIDDKIVDTLNVFKPDFSIIDGTTAINFGPTLMDEKFIVPVGVLVSGTDFVAVDTIGAKLIGIDNVKHLKMAAEKGFGCNNFNDINVIPSKDLIDRYKVLLDYKISNIPLEPHDSLTLFQGKEKACITGCGILEPGARGMDKEIRVKPCAFVFGKGHDIKKIDEYPGPFVVNGPCAINELKNYFDDRKKREKIRVYYINEHMNLTQIYTYLMKAMKIKFSDIVEHWPYTLPRMLELMKIALANGGKFVALS
ncbi:MAG: DUF362 domain-containing protein [Candidatus Hodarchaeota archaeon]